MMDHSLKAFDVSVIIPARDAETTIAATLESLLAQSYVSWRATIVDDGSTDRTHDIATSFARRDPRFRVVRGPSRGVGAARNAGLKSTNAPWVLFLDADDTIAEQMLEKMVRALRATPDADAVHCGWTLTDAHGKAIGSSRCEATSQDLFPQFATHCAFVMHSCIVRRTQVEKVGGFDEALRTSEDFDFWQKIARIGTRFTSVRDPLSFYRLRPNATWFQAESFLDDVLGVVRRGHASDPRLLDSLVPARYRNGAPGGELAGAEAKMVVWASAMAIARGEDTSALLNRITLPPECPLDPRVVADILFQALPLALCKPSRTWKGLLPQFGKGITEFLARAEKQSGVTMLALRAQHALETRIAIELGEDGDTSGSPFILGGTASFLVDVTAPVTDVYLIGVERAICRVRMEDQLLGSIVLPVADGMVPGVVIVDAIAGRFAWPILKIFFEAQGIYNRVSVVKQDDRWVTSRDDSSLARFDEDPAGDLRERVGWAIFLQEMFGKPARSSEDFYSVESLEDEPLTRVEEEKNIVDFADPIPSIAATSGNTVLVWGTLGGVPVAVARVPVYDGVASEAFIRLCLLERGRMDWARTAVREAVIGWPRDDSQALHQRLRDAAAKRSGDYTAILAGNSDGTVVVLGSAQPQQNEVIARRLALPKATADLMIENAADGQPVLRLGGGTVRQVLVLPELRGGMNEPSAPVADAGERADAPVETADRGLYGRHHFESLFASDADPWQYTSQYEETKYEQTLGMLPAGPPGKALEIGCAEGHFTLRLMSQVKSLVASDISEIALRRTAERCVDSPHLSFRQMDLARDPIEGSFDLILCSEMLYYMGDREALAAVGRKLAAALKPGGYLITAHANLVIDDPTAIGFDWRMPYGAKVIGETFASISDLIFDKELLTPLYRIQRFRRRRLPAFLRRKSRGISTPRTAETAHYAMPEEDVAKHVLGSGGVVTEIKGAVTTARLPILMYHHVSDTGPARLARWRVTPAMFWAQMRYLRDAGFRPTTLEEWREARRDGKALAGRRVLITFDDGFADFETQALPALQACHFPSMMFIPIDCIGQSAAWEGPDGEQLRLLDWEGVRRIHAAGVRIGAHGSSHRHLTTLGMEELAAELCRARIEIRRELGMVPDAIAYPFGDYDEAVARVAAACGYAHGLTTRDSLSGLDEDSLGLSRIEVMGQETLESFIAKLA